MSSLVAHRSKHNGVTHVCNSCLHPFSDPSALENHIPFCLQHPPQQVQYPDPDDCKSKFANVKKQHPVSFFLVADFEFFLTPTHDDDNSRLGFSSQALQLSIEAHTGTPPAADWKRPPGRPRRNWLQQVEEDIGVSVDAAWIAGQDRSTYDPQLVKRSSE